MNPVIVNIVAPVREGMLWLPRIRLKFAQKPRGIARINAWDGNILGNNCTGSDDDMIANRDGKDSGVRPNTYMITKLGWPPQLPFRCRPPANKKIIDEHSAVRNEAILPDRNEFTDERVRLNPAPLTDTYAPLYLDEWSNEAAICDDATIQIDRLHHSDIFSETDIDDGGITDFWLRHDSVA